MKQQLMIHIGNQLKLHLKINTKKAVGEFNSTFINTVGSPLFTKITSVPYRTVPYRTVPYRTVP